MKSDLDKASFKFDLPMERLQKVEVGVVTDHDLTEVFLPWSSLDVIRLVNEQTSMHRSII